MPKKILIVDDLSSNRSILNEMLREDYTIVEAADGKAALDVLIGGHADISAVLLDIGMPGIDGFEVLRRIRTNGLLASMPVIMITGSTDTETRLQSLTLGANDFVTKPYSSEIIKHCLRNNIAFSEASATVRAMQHDRLTGLYNREAFFQRVREMVSAHAPGYYVMVCLDIDKFKVINDQFGMQKGDEVLQHAAGVFRDGFHSLGGICCRVFADNFAILYPASMMDTEIVRSIRRKAAVVNGLVSPITFSTGRCIVDDVSIPPAAMYDRAMLAVASIKGRFDVKVAYYDDTMRERLIREQGIVSDMGNALSGGQFEAWFQPQYNYSSGAMIGAEALVRWRHPQKGLIPPADFIPLFEQNGFIYSLDKYIWEEVCRCLRKWLDEGRAPLPVSVNISRYDILHPDLVEIITGLLQKYALPVDLLRLEITESAFAGSTQHIVDTVKALIDFGFTVEVDDFGSGYSSLNTLKDVPAQIIKLDIKFLESSSDSARGGNIVESIVRMAKWLGVSVIAEGVETVSQANYLRSIGCSYMQGYLFARPMPVGPYEAYCRGVGKEERLLALETVENLDNNAFWDPGSMDTLIFNSYIGGACIFEFYGGNIELLRATQKYAEVIGNASITVEDVLKLNLNEHLDEAGKAQVFSNVSESIRTKSEVTGEYLFFDLPGCPHETYLRTTMRVIAQAGERFLVYCTNENITNQRKAELHERETAEKLRTIMANINGGVSAVTVDDAGRVEFSFANDQYYSILGYTREQFEEEVDDAFDLVSPEDAVRIRDAVGRVIETGRSDSYEYRCIRRNGTLVYLRCNAACTSIAGVGGRVLLSVITDISEMVAALQKERETAERMQSVMDNIDSGITAATLDEAGAITLLFTNDKFFEIHGYTRAQYEAEVHDKFDCVHPDDREKARQDTVRAYVTQTPTRLEYRLIRPDGSVCWVRVGLSSTRFTGIPQNVHLCIFTDITEEKQRELEIKETSARLQTMMDDMPGGFVRLRVCANGTLETAYFNDGMAALTGMRREELAKLYGRDALAGVHPDDVFTVRDAFSTMLSDNEAHSTRYRLRRGSGGYIWLAVLGRRSMDYSFDTFLNLYYTDATKQVEEEETQRALLDNLPGGAGLYSYENGNLSVIYLNKSYWALVGREAGDYSGILALSAVHPDDTAMVAQELSSAIELERDVNCDFRLRREPDGYIPVHLIGRIVPVEPNRYSIYATFTPISDEAMSIQETLPIAIQSMMDSSSEISFIKGKDLRYISCSRHFALLSGRKNEGALLGMTSFDVFPPALAAQNDAVDREVLESGKPAVDRDLLFPTASGVLHLLFSKYPLLDSKGNVLGIYGTGHDVTETRKMQSQLELLTNNVPGGIAIYEGRSDALDKIRLTYFSDGLSRLFGYSREEYERLAGDSPLSLVFPADVSGMYERIQNLVDNGVPMDYDYRAKVNGDALKWIKIKAVMGEPNGDNLTVNAVFFDVTEQKEATEKLRVSEQVNRLAILQSKNVVCQYNVETRQLMISPNVSPIFETGEMAFDVPYQTIRDGRVSPNTSDAYVAFYESILRGEKYGEVLYQRRSALGWRWIKSNFTAIFKENGEPSTGVISFTDVTESIEKDAAYRRYQQSLSSRAPESYTLFHSNIGKGTSFGIREGSLLAVNFEPGPFRFDSRTAEYADGYVAEADRESFIAFLKVDVLLADYQNGARSKVLEYREALPGGGVRWMRLTVELVERADSEEIEAYLLFEDIDEAKLLELAMIERAETDPLTGLLNRKTFEQKVDARIAESKIGVQHALLMLDIDSFKLVNDVFGHAAGDQTLIDIAELLGGCSRREHLVARLGGDEFVLFLPDISKDADAAKKAHQICEITRKTMSADVQISGSVGIALYPLDGDCFETLYKKADDALYYVKDTGKNNYAFYRDEMAAGEMPKQRAEVKSARTVSDGKKQRMLIIDDSMVDIKVLGNMFKDDYIIETAASGAAALVKLRHYGSAISLVLLDLVMPDMNGFAVLKQIKQNESTRDIPVIVVSGEEGQATGLAAIRAGAADFATKPVDPDILRVRVDSAVSKAANERLRAKNSYLEMQNDERLLYESALEGTGITFIEHHWLTGNFIYPPSLSRYLSGVYDSRGLWQILLSDMVADTKTVQNIQHLIYRIAEDRSEESGSIVVPLKTPQKTMHRFRLHVRKLANEYRLTDRIIITLNDLDYGTQ